MIPHTIIRPEKLAKANRYVNTLRNPAKRRYGFSYLAWIKTGGVGVEPDCGGPSCGGLSYMAAQAVRMNLDDMQLWIDAA